MTKKDFIVIADVLARLNRENPRDYTRKNWQMFIVELFCEALAGTNPRFDRSRFTSRALGA